MKNNTFLNLPDEVLLQIFSFLPDGDHFRSRAVSQLFKSLDDSVNPAWARYIGQYVTKNPHILTEEGDTSIELTEEEISGKAIIHPEKLQFCQQYLSENLDKIIPIELALDLLPEKKKPDTQKPQPIQRKKKIADFFFSDPSKNSEKEPLPKPPGLIFV